MGERAPIPVLITSYIDTRDQHNAGQRREDANQFLYSKFLYAEQCSKYQSPDTCRGLSISTKKQEGKNILLLVDVRMVELATVVYSRHAATK